MSNLTTNKDLKKKLTKDITVLVKDNFIKFEDQHKALQIVREAIMQYEKTVLESVISQVRTETQEEAAEIVRNITAGAIPETNDYANGWNACRKEYWKLKQNAINLLSKPSVEDSSKQG